MTARKRPHRQVGCSRDMHCACGWLPPERGSRWHAIQSHIEIMRRDRDLGMQSAPSAGTILILREE